MAQSIEALMQPIPGISPAGQDMSYAPVFDQIRDARRQDDPSLAMGDWEVALKVADWPSVIRLCEQTLCYHSKDLQLLVWYAEALVRVRGVEGACVGLQAIASWLRDYWESGFPVLDPQYLDERIGKLEWLNQHLSLALRQVPIVAPGVGGYCWLDWCQSREVDNLGLKSPQAMQAALDEGKLSGERFDKAAMESGRQWFMGLCSGLTDLAAAYDGLDRQLPRCFGEQAPALLDLRDTIQACRDLAARYLQRWDEVKSGAAASNDAAVISRPLPVEPVRPAQNRAHAALDVRFDGHIHHRQEAVMMLHAVAHYFRQNEPHSPVALLVERAARWAEMSLEEWLQHVVKDDATLQQLKELLGVPGS